MEIEENAAGGRKHREGKLRWNLMIWGPVILILKVLMYGSEKYTKRDAQGTVISSGDFNWQKLDRTEFRRALQGHVISWANGEVIDPESGHHHLAHAGCNILFELYFWIKDNE